MPFRNRAVGKLYIQAPNGQLITIDSTTVNPEIRFYSPDRTDFAFINAPNAGLPARVSLGMNSGKFVPGDATQRRSRLYLRDDTGVSTWEIVKESDQSQFGGYMSIDFQTSRVGYAHTATGEDQNIIVNNTGLDASVDAMTFHGNAGTPANIQFLDYNQINFNTGDLISGGRRIPRGNMNTPTSTAAGGTGTAVVGTEVRDAVLGDFVFTAVAGRRYKVSFVGRKLSGAANSLVSFNIRDGGAATPTIASTLLATAALTIDVVGGPGQITLPVFATFTATAGTHTLSVFTVCNAGGPAIAPVGQCELFVEDIGV